MSRRWPLLAIGASAFVAIWSGWVGLGALTGFGVIKPLPGIWDGLKLNTAITLPLGMEAYAAYALAVATRHGAVRAEARLFAWWSAGAALVLGAGGQVAYHVLVALKVTTAPWWIVALVACLPVLTLGAAAVLWHLDQPLAATDEVVKVATDSKLSGAPETVVVSAPSLPERAPEPIEEKQPTGKPAVDVDDLLLVAQAVKADIEKAGQKLTRRALIQGLRDRSVPCGTDKANELLRLLTAA